MSKSDGKYIKKDGNCGRCCIKHIIKDYFLVEDETTCLGSETQIWEDGHLEIEGDGEFLVISI